MTKKRVKLPEGNRFGHSVLEFKVEYSKGGHNYWNGTEEERGVYIHCTPLTVTPAKCSDGTHNIVSWNSSTPGWKQCLLKLNRKSQKAIDKVWNVVESYIDKLTDAYVKNEQAEVVLLLQEIRGKI